MNVSILFFIMNNYLSDHSSVCKMTIQRKNIKCPGAPHKASRHHVPKYVYVHTNTTVIPERPTKAMRPSSMTVDGQIVVGTCVPSNLWERVKRNKPSSCPKSVCPCAPRKERPQGHQYNLGVHNPTRLFN